MRMTMFKGGIALAMISIPFTITGCEPDEYSEPRTPSLPVTYNLASDKAIYNPGEAVQITVSPALSGPVNVRYKFLNTVIGEATAEGTALVWYPPDHDFRGYMVELVEPGTESKPENILATMGVDVSSDWTRFPRYGFLSVFDDKTDVQVNEIIDNLSRHRINAIQYYDWHYKHHQPLAGTVEAPSPIYRDIINREIHLSTIMKYIDAGHSRNIRAMFYNLVYGALKDAAARGVRDEWYVYTNAVHTEKDKHTLAPPFTSDIFLMDPSNAEWQEYLIKENRKVYDVLPFDGFHMDQLGDRGTRYNYSGDVLDLAQGFKPFIEAIDHADPDRNNVLNAVNQYGQQYIVEAPVDFLYTEVWSPNESYSDLASIIVQNSTLSSQALKTVIAAYVNYELANTPGYFNTPSVLMTDAVIFAFGGAHIELGEHMLAKEYFPNDNLAMRDDLKRILVSYYDFLVAYQNLLRDGGVFNAPEVISADNKATFNNWPPQSGKVSVVGKEVGDRQVIHLLNFTNAKTMSWRDNGGIQDEPFSLENLQVRLTTEKPVTKVWYASPDFRKGASADIEFAAAGSQISFTIPGLQYWSMIVIEYD